MRTTVPPNRITAVSPRFQRPMRAGLAWDEEVVADAGYTVLVPSRPGDGRTPLSTSRSLAELSDVIRALCAHLGISKVAAVVGISGGGRAVYRARRAGVPPGPRPAPLVLVELDARTGYTDRLVHAGGKGNRPPELRRNLLYVVIAEATNRRLGAMVESCGVPSTCSLE